MATKRKRQVRSPDDERLVLTIPEVAKLLGLSRGGAYWAAKHKRLPTIRLGDRVLVPKAALTRMLESAERQT